MSQESGDIFLDEWHSCIVDWVSVNVKHSVSRFAFYFAHTLIMSPEILPRIDTNFADKNLRNLWFQKI